MTKVRPAVKGIIKRNGKILILKAEAGREAYWVLPGGKVEYGEEPRQALEREIKEEINCSAEIGRPVGMYYFFVGPESEGDQIVLTAFETDIGDQEIDIENNPADENITEYRWMEPKELMERTGNESLRKLIQEYSFDTPKMVRDRIPEIAEENGDSLETETLDEDEIGNYLAEKLVEESREFREGRDREELADILEVFKEVLKRKEIEMEEIEELRNKKGEERGGFDKGILLRDIGKEK